MTALTLTTQGLRRWAEFSPDRKFRYLLGREWDASKPRVCWIGHNPSGAGEYNDDMTATKYVGFSQRNDFGSYVALNISPAITANPVEAAAIEISPESRFHCWAEAMSQSSAVVFAWGDDASRLGRHVIDGAVSFALLAGKRIYCLGRTKNGNPRHASRLPYSTTLERW